MRESLELPVEIGRHATQKEILQVDGITVADSVSILAPATLIYRFWRDLKNLPRFFNHLQSVEVMSDSSSHWVWKAMKNKVTVEWDSHIIEDVPGLAISWQTVADAEVKHAGTVRFTELPFGRGTVVDVKMLYAPPGGKMTDLVEKMLGESPKQNLGADLKKLREIIETGEVPTTEGQPRGSLH